MISKLLEWWQKAKKPLEIFVVIIACILLAVLLVVIALAYIFKMKVPGLSGKTLWDWLQLLIIPAVLAVGGYAFNLANTRTEQGIVAQRYENDQRIALDKQREDLLQAYLDRMSELLLKEKLRSSAIDAEVRNVARVRTITILFQLDAKRIGYVIAFLRESGLMSTKTNDSVVSLNGADFSAANFKEAVLDDANLSGANLIGANLSFAFLERANLSKANLSEAKLYDAYLYDANLSEADLWCADLYKARLSMAKLSGANLTGANLSEADLTRANFTEADLTEADLSGANLSGTNLEKVHLLYANLGSANLSEANLEGAIGITNEQLEKQAESLKGAIMPDGSKHP